ncbi:MAG: M20/M25/M40 family metallo-hydrolase [Pseudomonadota bacterium]
MDFRSLPVDVDKVLDGLRPWIECESPTFEPAAVNRMMAIASEHLMHLGASVEPIPGPPGLGDCVRATFPHPRQGEGGILILAHLDTVHPIGTLKKLPFERSGDRCTGPGLCDMKGGTYSALEAVRLLNAAGAVTPLPVTVLLTSDEEIGTPGTRALIEAEAKRHQAVLVPEPGLMNEPAVVTGRYAIARFNLTAHGLASHAGIRLKAGRSAIRVMADHIPLIEDMTSEDCTYAVGVVNGGRWVNCVPTLCHAEALSMAKRQSDLDAGIEKMMALSRQVDEHTAFEVSLGVVRPVWERGEGTMALYERAKHLASELGITLHHDSAGGGSDANFTGALGIPTLDGLGPDGEYVHTLHEYIEVDSLRWRTQLIAALLMDTTDEPTRYSTIRSV